MSVGHLFNHRIRKGSAFPIIAVAAVSLIAACASVKSPDYRFDVVDQPVAVGAHSEFDVRLTDVSTGQPVSNATIAASSLEMTHYRPTRGAAPPAKVPMPGEVQYIGPDGPGVYRFMGDVSMPGTWKLTASAKVPGKSEPINGTASFEVGE
jgi:hypothetical protein